MTGNNTKNKKLKMVLRQAPLELFVSSGTFEGEVNLQWDAVKEARQYIVQLSKNGSSWQQIDIVSDPHYSISGLKSGKTYSFRISALYPGGQGKWSAMVAKKVK